MPDFDLKGRPIHAVNDKGEPICGGALKPSKRNPKGGICHSQKRMDNGRCFKCGGKSPSGEASPHFKTGQWTKENMTREALLLAVANSKNGPEKQDLLRLCIDKMYDAVESGDTTAIFKVFEQLAGGPKQTTEVKLEDGTILQIIGRLAARWDGKTLHSTQFLEELKSELAQVR